MVKTRGTTVLIASRLFPPEPGAAAYRLGNLAQALCARGAQVEVLTTRPPRGVPAHNGSPVGPRVHRWPVLRDAGGNVRGYLQFASFDWPLLLRLLLARRPDIIVVEPPPTTAAAVWLVSRLRRIPYAYYAGDISSAAAEQIGVSPLVVAGLRRLESRMLRGAVLVVTVSDGMRTQLQTFGVPPDRITVAGTGIDTQIFAPATQEALLRASGREPTLVYAGTMSEIHGAQVFVHAFGQVVAQFPHARLLMLGQGVERRRLQALAESVAPGQVTFEGLVSGSRVAEVMGTAHAGLASVRPGGGYDFAFATKMFAATSCGTPVIYAGVGPGAVLVDRESLGWATAWDPDAVAAAMRQALAETPSAARRAALRDWTVARASAARAGDIAAAAVLDGMAPAGP